MRFITLFLFFLASLSAEVLPPQQTIGYIHIGDHEESISQATWIYVKSALDYYKIKKPSFIILHLNTPGGEVFAAQKISDALKNFDTQEGIPVVAVIDNWAISAGAMLAYSCRTIVTVKDGIMGAAEPVIMGQSGQMEKASEKVNSAMRADFAARASFFDRNPLVAEAMVDSDILLVKRDGEIISLDKEQDLKAADEVISKKGKLLTLDAKQMKSLSIAEFILLPQKLVPITQEEKAKGVWPASKELLFQEPYFQKVSNAVIDQYKMDAKTTFLAWLSHPLVASLLSMGLILGIYVEISHPGLGFPAVLALICLLLMIVSSFSLEIVSWLEGINYDFDTGTFNAAGEAFFNRLVWGSGAILLSFLLIVVFAKYMASKFYTLSPLVLKGGEQEGYFAGGDPKKLPKNGAQGIVLATLRPSGKIEIDGEIYEGVAEGGLIEKGERVYVTRVSGNSVFVEKEGL